MALGSITSLGVGSGLDLQTTLDSLREVDETSINLKKTSQSRLEEQVVAFDSINVKLIEMKSSALSLSLKSNFLERSPEVSDGEIASATVQSGAAITSHALEVKQLALKSSWQSEGVAEGVTPIYAAPATGISDSETSVISVDTPLFLTLAQGDDQVSISLDLGTGASLDTIAQAINQAGDNQTQDGSTRVTATVVEGDGGHYIRLAATDGQSDTNNQIQVSGGLDFLSPDLTFSYRAGAANDEVFVAVPAGTSYQEMVSIINEDDANGGITAALIDDGTDETPWRLTLTSNESGEGNRIFLGGIEMTELKGADGESLNARFTVDGIEYQRQTNGEIEDVIQGVSLDLKKVGETQVGVTASYDKVKEYLTALIDTYNELATEIGEESSYSEDVNEDNGLLADVLSVKRLDSQIGDLLGTTVQTGESIASLYDLGMTINRDGSISLDETVLEDAFSAFPEAVSALFLGDAEQGITGLGDVLNDRFKALTDGTSGTANVEKNSAQERIDRLTQSIEDAEERLNTKYDLLAKQFVNLDAVIGKLNSQSTALESLIESFNTAAQD